MASVSTKQAIEWMAQEMGKNPVSNRAEVLVRLNDVRRLFYTIYQKIRLNFYSEACFSVKEFTEPCQTNECPKSYFGISLPQEFQQIESIWIDSLPIPIFNGWYEYRDGIKSGQSTVLRSIDIGGDHPLPNPIPYATCAKLRFIATDATDAGKDVVVSFVDSDGEHAREVVKLTPAGSSTVKYAKWLIRPGGIVLPTDLCGGVIVQNADTNEFLGHLSPKATIPAFRRLKITGVCATSLVRVKAIRRFADVFYDWEAVETDNKLAILEAHRYLKIMEVNSSDAQWLAKARNHIENATQYIGGENYRDEGGATVRHIRIGPRPNRRQQLRFKRRL